MRATQNKQLTCHTQHPASLAQIKIWKALERTLILCQQKRQANPFHWQRLQHVQIISFTLLPNFAFWLQRENWQSRKNGSGLISIQFHSNITLFWEKSSCSGLLAILSLSVLSGPISKLIYFLFTHGMDFTRKVKLHLVPVTQRSQKQLTHFWGINLLISKQCRFFLIHQLPNSDRYCLYQGWICKLSYTSRNFKPIQWISLG